MLKQPQKTQQQSTKQSTQTQLSPLQQKFLKNIILRMKIQKMLKTWKKLSKKTKQRRNILKQWQITQQSYIKDINTIIQKIQKPLKIKQVITQQQDRIMFPNLDAMLKLSNQLLIQIKKFINNFNPRTTLIGNSLINFHKYFIIYREYCNNYYKSQQILKKLDDNPQLQPIKSTLMMDIQSYIIKPVQRPPKYQLLLRQYQKCLQSTHPDYKSLSIAIQKYHEVNQQNNQSMDLQIRNQKMIILDKKYGGIINTTRRYLFQQYFKNIYNEHRLKMYVFNDLIIIVKITNNTQDKDKQKQQGYKKIFLNGQSFIYKQMDGKYIINKLFICGIKDNIHCIFLNSTIRDRIYQRLSKIISQLYRKQNNKLQYNINKKNKMNVMNIQQLQIKYNPKIRVLVVGVQKRPTSSINLIFQTYYILKLQAPYPSPLFQYTYIKFQQLIQLYQYIHQKNKQLILPILDDKPLDMGIYDIKKNKTKIIQCRQIYIQRFINYILRCQQLSKYNQYIRKILGINLRFWEFVQKYGNYCQCQLCINNKLKDNISVIQYQGYKQQIKTMISINGNNNSIGKNYLSSAMSQTNSINNTSINFGNKLENSEFLESQACFILQPSSISSNFNNSMMSNMSNFGNFCIANNFTLAHKITTAQLKQLTTLSYRLTWLQAKLGRIDYSLLPKQPTQNQQQQQQFPIKISINLLSLKPDQIINVKIYKNSTILQILDTIAKMYKIQTMRDFSIFIQYQNISRMLDRDEILIDVLDNMQYQYQQTSIKNNKQIQSRTLWQKLSYLKKLGTQMILGKKPKLYIKKYIYINQQLQIQACQSNPQRYTLIIQQIFYRFRYQLLILNPIDTKKLSALYYIINYMDKLAHLNQNNFQIQKLRNLLPQNKWNLCNKQIGFQNDVYQYIKQYQQYMENMEIPVRNKQRISDSNKWRDSQKRPSNTISSKIQIIYNYIIKLVCKYIGWYTLFIQVINYDPPTLPGNSTQLLLGINRKKLIIIRHKQLQPLLQIDINKLQYKITVHSIFIQTEQKILRFDGQMMYDIKKMIQIYKLMADKFGND